MTALAVLGTASDVGKSVLATALCRIHSDRGLDVAPYKAQNMSNNAAVTPEGGEIGRAQFVQALAARKVPHTDHNPVLLKPNTDLGSQVVVHGQVLGNRTAREWFGATGKLREEAFRSLDRLVERHDLVVLEGAGSCAEVNLRPRDYVNFDAAQRARAKVILVADIDRGGVFAQVLGTLRCMAPGDRVDAVIINRFRGDASLFDEGRAWLEREAGVPILGVVPWYRGFRIESEDAVPLEAVRDPSTQPDPSRVRVAVIRLPHVANFTDVAPLMEHPQVDLHWLSRPRSLEDYDLVVLPGSKNTRGDLRFLQGWELGRSRVLGLCGGYQLLGRTIADPHGVEGEPGVSEGLGLLPVDTVLAASKTVRQVEGRWGDLPVEGYEIHMGETTGGRPWLDLDGTPEGAEHGPVRGTYLHGLLDSPGALLRVLSEARPDLRIQQQPSMREQREAAIHALALHVEDALIPGTWERIGLFD